jgi:hypothetical protein
MSTLYVRRALAIATAPNAEIINAIMEQMGHGQQNLRVELVPADGPDDAEPTHYGCNAQFTEADVGPYTNSFSAMVFWCDIHYDTYVLRTTNVDALQASIGQVVRFDDMAAAMGLKRRVVAIDFGG